MSVNGTPVPLLFVSSQQINAQLPYNLSGSASMSIHTPGGVSNGFTFSVSPTAPSVFLSGSAGPVTGIATGLVGQAWSRLDLAVRPWQRGLAPEIAAVEEQGLHEQVLRLGAENTFLRGRLVDGGRLLNHCITRTDPHQRTYSTNGFINRYVFPDGELVPVGRLT